MNQETIVGEALKDVEIKTFLTGHITDCNSEIEYAESRINDRLEEIREAQESIEGYREEVKDQSKTKAMYERMLLALEKGGVI